MLTICVYCGLSNTVHAEYFTAARQLGAALARRNLGLVYGAGNTGLMGAVASGALAAGGQVIGVMPELWNAPQYIQPGLSRLEVTPDIQSRKRRMAELANGFIALPGGLGTLDELFENLTWAQIGLHRKPVGLLNTRNYFDPLLSMFRHGVAEGFIYDEQRLIIEHARQPEALLDQLCAHLE